ncbi:helix-turn-helix transcriptional regulator [Paraburkholderia fungorum]|uniref:helix-turn-helix transcriptional regulator n=1 Tax=Paraburkholderia fungorum TaxID=134537 RepID=UPI0038B9122A
MSDSYKPPMLAEALRLLRIYHDMTQTELSREIYVSTAMISEMEKGNKNPSLEMLTRYSKAFNVPISSILFFSEELQDETLTRPIRKAIAKKIVAILGWVADRAEA